MLFRSVVSVDALRRKHWQTHARFRFDCVLDFMAQPGSDWTEHHRYAARALVTEGRAASLAIDWHQTIPLSEPDIDRGDRA